MKKKKVNRKLLREWIKQATLERIRKAESQPEMIDNISLRLRLTGK
jgi:hypothetical protein